MSKPPRVLIDVHGRLGGYAEPLGDVAVQLLRHMGTELGLGAEHELSLVLTDNPTIRRLNQQWRQIDRPTDVLSFPMHALRPGQLPPAGPVGDIVISLPYTRLAAREVGVTLEYHLGWLLAHGLLHLLGHDHNNDSAERRMRREEQRLLAKEFCA